VIPRRVFAILTTLLVVITVAVAVVFALHALLSSLGDIPAARVSRWMGIAGLAAMLVVSLLLLIALGLNTMRSSDE
jgi:hypothetical protein